MPPAARYRAAQAATTEPAALPAPAPARATTEPAALVLRGQAALTALTAAIGRREPALTAVNGAQTQLRVDTMVAGRVSALKVCAVQIRATPGDVSGNVRRAAELIRASPGYHLYVLPELSSCGYGTACSRTSPRFRRAPATCF